MASGKQHFIANAGLAIASSVLLTKYPELQQQLIIGNILGIFLTPDIDNPSGTYTEALLSNGFAKLLRMFGMTKRRSQKIANPLNKLFVAINAPYGVFVPHRDFLSHFPGISVISIGLYYYLLYFVYCRVTGDISYSIEYFHTTYRFALYVWAVHNTIHFIMDGGLITFWGKEIYTLTYPFYLLTTKLFPQGD